MQFRGENWKMNWREKYYERNLLESAYYVTVKGAGVQRLCYGVYYKIN